MAAKIERANARNESIQAEKERFDDAEEDLGKILINLWTTLTLLTALHITNRTAYHKLEQFKAKPRLKSTRKRKQLILNNTELQQKLGVLAIGETICRKFGLDGIFYGTINAFRKEGDVELYTVRYVWESRPPNKEN